MKQCYSCVPTLLLCIISFMLQAQTRIGFERTTTNVLENAGSATINVRIENPGTEASTARLRVQRAVSTALPAEDYVLVDTVINFQPGGAATQNLRITVVDDNAPRSSRYLILTLAAFTNAVAGATATHALLISDEDARTTAALTDVPRNIIRLDYVSSIKVDSVVTGNVSAEISAYEPVSRRLFTTNSIQNTLEIIDLSNPARPRKRRSIAIAPYGGGINSVAIARTFIAVAVEGTPIQNNGKVVFFNNNGDFLSEVPVGALPDMLTFTPDGNKLLVANEGEPNTNYSNDPEGSVSIIDMRPGAPNLTAANVTTADFRGFNADSTVLRRAGVRIFGPRATVARDVEPEYITVSDDNKTAYVVLQENNAVAILNLETNRITAIVPLGLKDWAGSNWGFDASDEAGAGIFFNNWNVRGIYQPDAIAYFQSGGVQYLISANEGDAREYDAITEGLRLSSTSYVLDPTVFPNAATLKRNDLLGRLNVTRIGGDRDGDGDFDEIHTLGARSFTIWNASTGAVVWDSGDELERITAADPVWGAQFNANNAANTIKNRSDDKGPEPEGVAVATIGGRRFAFIALERIGGVMVYDITDPTRPFFVQYTNPRTTGTTIGGDRGAEGIIYIPANESPVNEPLVVLSNEISGTVTIYRVAQLTISTQEPSVLDQVAVFPNPTNGQFQVLLPELPVATAQLTLFNSLGQWIQDQHEATAGLTQIDLSQQPAGMYWLRIVSGTAQKIVPVVVSK
jgi:DNA-binding beta-propeller fold protein YncE